MWPQTYRPISQAEAAVVTHALAKAATGIAAPGLESQVQSLVVVAYCPCGCGSVTFGVPGQDHADSRQLADGCAQTTDGTLVGVFVWGTAEVISGLEIYQMDEEAASMPDPATIRKWREGELQGDF